VERFRHDLDGTARERVAAMMAFARSHGLTATPHFAIGGHVIEGARSEDLFVRVIEAALAEAQARLAAGTPRAQVYQQSLAFLAAGP
jgi:predicted DsbA family dithiol-disulfide isomerase